jgi:hypothetical protein
VNRTDIDLIPFIWFDRVRSTARASSRPFIRVSTSGKIAEASTRARLAPGSHAGAAADAGRRRMTHIGALPTALDRFTSALELHGSVVRIGSSLRTSDGSTARRCLRIQFGSARLGGR